MLYINASCVCLAYAFAREFAVDTCAVDYRSVDDPTWYRARQVVVGSRGFRLKTMSCQDRLGTRIRYGKVKKRKRFPAPLSSGVRSYPQTPVRFPIASEALRKGATNQLEC
eukprot:COSAG06_NODE_9223_length_1954_cov_6.771429_3_plen_111_part_00